MAFIVDWLRTRRGRGVPNRLSVVVTTYRREDALDLVLRALLAQTDRAFEIIVADDGSAPETAAVIARWQARSDTQIHHAWQPDEGFRAAEARNRALLRASGDYVIFIDGDCVPRRHFVQRHRALAEPGWFVAGNRMLLSKTLTQKVLDQGEAPETYAALRWAAERLRGGVNRLAPLVDLPDGPWRYARPKRWRGASACNLGAHIRDLMLVDGFDAAYRGWGCEDIDLAVRLMRAGVRRKDGRFSTGVIHLWHEENDRSRLAQNRSMLSEVVASDRVVATLGLSRLDPAGAA